jgi:hypothetical protein
MRTHLLTSTLAGLACVSLSAADTSVAFKQLPAGVQAAATKHLEGGTVKGASKEIEKGQTFYEVETVRNGRTRDLLFDATGRLVEVEEAVPLDAVPRAVRTALEAQGAVISVESVTRGATVSYEGVVRKNGKRTEVALAADGTPHKP